MSRFFGRVDFSVRNQITRLLLFIFFGTEILAEDMRFALVGDVSGHLSVVGGSILQNLSIGELRSLFIEFRKPNC